MLKPGCDIFFVAGEPSGDAYAAAIVRALYELNPNFRLAGAGCSELRRSGAEIDVNMEGNAVMGFLPVVQRFPEFYGLFTQVIEVITSRRPGVVVTVDYPGFNLQLVTTLRRRFGRQMRFVHVVAPQVWAWRSGRAKRVARLVDRLLCFFPFEPPYFTRHGGRADFVGHPLLDLIRPREEFVQLDRMLHITPADDVLMVAPGSREREVDALLPVMDEAVRLLVPYLRRRGSRVLPVIAKSPELPLGAYRRHCPLPVVEGGYRTLCQRARLGFIASGTACLEAALIGLPHVITYKSDRLSMVLAKHLIQCRHIGLPNIVADRRIVPEVLQDELLPNRLAAHGLRLWEGERRRRMLADLAGVQDRLGRGAIRLMALKIAEEFSDYMRS